MKCWMSSCFNLAECIAYSEDGCLIFYCKEHHGWWLKNQKEYNPIVRIRNSNSKLKQLQEGTQ